MDGESSENFKLRKEIAYLTGLINSHTSSNDDCKYSKNTWRKGRNQACQQSHQSLSCRTKWSKPRQTDQFQPQAASKKKESNDRNPLNHVESLDQRIQPYRSHKIVDSFTMKYGPEKPVSSQGTSRRVVCSQGTSKRVVSSPGTSRRVVCSPGTSRKVVLPKTGFPSTASVCNDSQDIVLSRYSLMNETKRVTESHYSDPVIVQNKEKNTFRKNAFKKINYQKGKTIPIKKKNENVVVTSTPLKVTSQGCDQATDTIDLSSIAVDLSTINEPPSSLQSRTLSTDSSSTTLSSSPSKTFTSSPNDQISKFKVVRSNKKSKLVAIESKCLGESSLVDVVTSGPKDKDKPVNASTADVVTNVLGCPKNKDKPVNASTSPYKFIKKPMQGKDDLPSKNKLKRKNSIIDSTALNRVVLKPTIKSKYKLVRKYCAVNAVKSISKSTYRLVRKHSALNEKNVQCSSSIVNKYNIVRRRSNQPSKVSSVRAGKYKLFKMSPSEAGNTSGGSTSWRRSNYSPKGNSTVKTRKSRYTLVKKQGTVDRSVAKRKGPLPSRSKLKLDRRQGASKHDQRRHKSHRLLMIGGVVYNSSRNTLRRKRSHSSMPVRLKKMNGKKTKTLSVRGVKYKMDSSGKSLLRVSESSISSRQPSKLDIGGVSFVHTKPGTLVRSSSVHYRSIASRVLHRSIRTAATRHTKKKQEYCIFYNRFGKCNRGEKCHFIHDPKRVAVCTRFLRGTCKIDHCPFSHNVTKEKMPVCSYFLRGICNNDSCPYLHVNVGKNAEVCSDFIGGFCKLGEKCKKKHTHVCPKHDSKGSCPEGATCKLLHPRLGNGKSLKRKKPQKDVISTAHSITKTTAERDEAECIIPNKLQKLSQNLPSFISLNDSTLDLSQGAVQASSPIQIRPRFLQQ